MNTFNGTTCKTAVLEVHEPQASRIDDMGIPAGNSHKLRRRKATSQLVRMWPNRRFGHMSDCFAVSHISNKCQIEDLSFMRNPARISHIARRPVSALWTSNYTTTSSEAMNSGNRYYWKVRGLDGGGEQ